MLLIPNKPVHNACHTTRMLPNSNRYVSDSTRLLSGCQPPTSFLAFLAEVLVCDGRLSLVFVYQKCESNNYCGFSIHCHDVR